MSQRVHDSHSSDWRLRHGDGDARRAAEEQGLRRPRVGSERLSADERLPAGSRASRAPGLSIPSTSPSDLDLVVVGNAISRGNPELEEVLDRKIRYCSLPEAVRDHFLWGARSVVIAGTHGKTTTTSLTGWLLTHGGADPSVLIGGIAENFDSSYRVGGGREFVIEGDEYDSAFFDKTAKFLKYLPDIAVVNNIEFDHADIYPDLDAIRLAFQRFVNLIPRRGLLLLGADNAEALALRHAAHCRVETFGLADGADWQAHDLQVTRTSTTFSVRRGGQRRRHLRAAAARRVQRPQRAGGPRRRRRGRPEHRHDGGVRCGASRASAAGWSIAAPCAAYRSTTTSRIIRPRSPRRSPASGRRIRTGAIWAIFEPRSATSCRRDLPGRLRARLRQGGSTSSCRRCSARRLPEEQRLSAGAAGRRPQGVGHRRPLHPAGRRHRDDASPARRGPAIS